MTKLFKKFANLSHLSEQLKLTIYNDWKFTLEFTITFKSVSEHSIASEIDQKLVQSKMA